jgi:glycerophosphoryl diester phosphodiesterase
VLSSFAPWVVKKIKDLDSGLKTGWIVGQERVLKANRLARWLMSWIFDELGADSAHLHYEILTPEVVARFQSRNIPVYAWTVNNIDRMKYLIEIGIDGIITNRPGTLRSILNGDAISDHWDIIKDLEITEVGS